jgi:hypothetical protein
VAPELYYSATILENSEVFENLIAAQLKNSTTHDSYEARREGDHDGLALACWAGERYMRKVGSLPKPAVVLL